jgi:hypothetical protein
LIPLRDLLRLFWVHDIRSDYALGSQAHHIRRIAQITEVIRQSPAPADAPGAV